MIKSGSCTVGLGNQFVTINSFGPQMRHIVDFLCCDLHKGEAASARAAYDLMEVGSKPRFSLWQGDRQLYFGTSRYDLAYTLMNEIVYHCIAGNTSDLAIHAAALGSSAGGVLLPGTSGSGKSTLTGLLVSKGSNYLTDELVLLQGKNARMHALTRPLSIKTGSLPVLADFCRYSSQEVITGTNGCMVPHRLLNTHCPATPAAGLILFPKYEQGTATKLHTLSPAQACAGLIECSVNARNIPGHGISTLAEFTRKIPACRLTYSNFSGLHTLLVQSFPQLFS